MGSPLKREGQSKEKERVEERGGTGGMRASKVSVKRVSGWLF